MKSSSNANYLTLRLLVATTISTLQVKLLKAYDPSTMLYPQF